MIDEARAPIAPDLMAALAAFPDFDALDNSTLPAFRTMLAVAPPALGLDRGVVVERVAIGANAIDALLYRPAAIVPGRPSILAIHGGGFVMGSAERDDAVLRDLSRRLGCIILAPNYRLAPEHPYPAALDDCQDSLAWLLDFAIAQGAGASVMVRGISAGGNLAAALALKLRDTSGSPIVLLDLLYPMLDDRTGSHPCNGRHGWTAHASRFAWNAYLCDDRAGVDKRYAAPARALDLAGMPPVFLACGSIDFFAEECLSFAQRLINGGVPVELHIYPGAYHGFPAVVESTAARMFARDETAALLRACVDRE